LQAGGREGELWHEPRRERAVGVRKQGRKRDEGAGPRWPDGKHTRVITEGQATRNRGTSAERGNAVSWSADPAGTASDTTGRWLDGCLYLPHPVDRDFAPRSLKLDRV
jgi:hypothetical protein